MKVKSALRAVALFLVAASADERLVQAHLQSNNVNGLIVTVADNGNAGPVRISPNDILGPNGKPLSSFTSSKPGQDLSSYQYEWSGNQGQRKEQYYGSDAPDNGNAGQLKLQNRRWKQKNQNANSLNEFAENYQWNGDGSGDDAGLQAVVYRDQFGNIIQQGSVGGSTTSYSKGLQNGFDNSNNSECSSNNQAQAVVGPPMFRDEKGKIIAGATASSYSYGNAIPQAVEDVPIQVDKNGKIIDNSNGKATPQAVVDVPLQADKNGKIIDNSNGKGIPVPNQVNGNGKIMETPVAGPSMSNIIADGRSP